MRYRTLLPLLLGAALLAGCATSRSANDAAITDFGTVAREGQRLVGRAFSFTNMRVMSVVGDSTFYMSPREELGGARLFFVLENLAEQETGAGGADGVYDVDEGDVYDAEGVIARLTPTLRQRWNVQGDFYLSVRRLRQR